MPAVVPLIAAGGVIGGALINQHGQTQAAETQAGAAEKATDAQAKAAEDALHFQEQVYNAKQQAVNPYQNYGAGALAALGQGLGVTPGNIPSGAIPMPNNTAPTWTTQNPDGSRSGRVDPATLAASNQAMPSGFPNAAPQPNNINPFTGQPRTAQQLSQSGVRLQSPDGSEMQVVPQEQAQYYISKGAKVVQ